jgi:putative endonuclease
VSSRAVGARFEELAAEHLRRRGFRIVETNYTCRGGEIDLVCDDAGTLVFVEVRARRDDRHGAPEETIGSIKRKRLVHAARTYLARRRGGDDCACRFDVVAIEGSTVTHIADAFQES